MNEPYVYKIRKVSRVIDGDTVDVIIDLGFDISLAKRIRLSGVDTPESRTRDLEEKKFGLEAKEWLKEHLAAAKEILIRTDLGDEKYGRVLGILYTDGDDISLNEHIIEQGYAWKYEGGTKKKDFDTLLSRRTS
jgi:micrococcal nuclease